MNTEWRNERLYTLGEGKSPVATDDVLAWGDWFEKADRALVRTKIDAAVHVSTMFTGIDHSRSYKDPVLWETTIFGGPHHGMGQRYTSAMSARVGHSFWCKVARGTLAPEAVPCTDYALRVDPEEAACRADETTTWLTRLQISNLLDISEQTLVNYGRLGLLHPRRVTYLEPDRSYTYREPRRHRLVLYDVRQLIAVCRRNADARVPRSWKHGKLVPDLPQFLKPSHAALTDFYVAPGAITLVEFRVRYGYRCKRVACPYCQDNHYNGPWGSCRSNEDSGTRYRVSRADGTVVSSELGAPQAWKAAHRLEQGRLAPILIARDALAEGRIAAAREIADQLEPDLAVPLRREVERAVEEVGPASGTIAGPASAVARTALRHGALPVVEINMRGGPVSAASHARQLNEGRRK